MEPYVKIKVLIRSLSFDGEESVETVWAHPLSTDTYRIENLPFFAYGISLHDEVLAPLDPETGLPTFEKVLSKSGNRTLRLHLPRPIEANRRTRAKLKELCGLGCGHEFLNSRYLVLNVPASLDAALIEKLIGMITSEWERADPTYED